MVKELIPISEYLYIPSVEVEDVNDQFLQESIQDLKDTYKKLEGKALGLSMCQIWDQEGVECPRVFIAQMPDASEPEVFINPRGVGSGGTIKNWESCLSFPNNRPKRKGRKKNYTIVYTKEDGTERSFKTGDVWSRILQHEMDHLNGKTLF